MAKKQRPGAPEGRALQYEDLDPEGRRAARENWAELGKVKSRHGAAMGAAKAAQASTTNPMYEAKMGHRMSSLEAVGPHLEDKPMTLPAAAGARVRLVNQSAQRTRESGNKSDLGGADWYFTHHNLIREAGRQHGFSPHEAIAATTSLSPLNAPETERPAGAAAMKLVGEPGHTVKMTRSLHQAASKVVKRMGGPPIPKEHVGGDVKVEDLHHTHVAAIGAVNAQQRNKGKPIETTAPQAFQDLGATRLSDEVSRSVAHLRGHIPESDVISPHGGPKVWSYKESTKAAVPGSAEHGEFTTRLHHFIHGDPKQGVMDLWGLRHSKEGVLSPEHHTAEDTWMQAISTRQKPLNVPGTKGRGVSVAKMAGSDKNLAAADAMRKSSPTSDATVASDPRITSQGISHALNNKATRMAANKIKIEMGHETAAMPAIAVQGMAWTEIRRQADKDPEYKISQMAANHRQLSAGRQFEVHKKQGRLF